MSTIPSNSDSRLHLPRSVRYALVALLVLLVAPALLQGVMAFFHAFTHTLEMTIVALGLGGGGFWLWYSDRQKIQQRESIQGTLDRFVSKGQPFKLLDFAAKVGLSVSIVKPYLERVSRELRILVEVDDRGTIYYYVRDPNSTETSPSPQSDGIANCNFLPESVADRPLEQEIEIDRNPPNCQPENNANSEPLDREATPLEYRPFIQAELARRLKVSASTIGKRKLKPDFTEWVRSKDPQGMGWRYSQVTKQFYPQR
jgi:hypothetical protein